ncbi:MAG: sugar ABC transporter permease [Spirochaetales bacterium]|nr:sugar ABC transporter permease [Spirochaetales bacterium]
MKSNKLTMYKVKDIGGNYLFLLPFLVFFCTFTIGPILYSFFMSLHRWPILAKEHPFVGLDNYRALLKDKIWWQALRNTLYFATLTAVTTTIFSFVLSNFINNLKRGANFYRFVFYTPVVLSVAAMGIVMGWTFNTQYGIVNAFIGLFGIAPVNWLGSKELVIPTLSLASVWWGFGGPMIIFLAGFQNLPSSYFEAARIDGANNRIIFFKLTIPLMAPSILFIIITQFIAHLQVFGQSYLITGGGPGRESYTTIYYLYQTAWRYYRMGYGSTIAIGLAVIIFTITIIQYLVGNKRAKVEY